MTILPLGSVVLLNNIKYMILGYEPVFKEEKALILYVIEPYPAGFTDQHCLGVCEMGQIDSVIFTGPRYEKNEEFLDSLSKYNSLTEKADGREINAFLQDAVKLLTHSGEEV